MTICEAITYDKKMRTDDWRQRYRQCRKTAEGELGGVALCSVHIGMAFTCGGLYLTEHRELKVPTPVTRYSGETVKGSEA